MKFKVFLISVFFVCILLPGISHAADKVVVVPLVDAQSVRPTAQTYSEDASGGSISPHTACEDMILTSEGDCFLMKVEFSASNLDGATNQEIRNYCSILLSITTSRWKLCAHANAREQTSCIARCLKW